MTRITATAITDASFYEKGRPPKQECFGGWAAYVRIDGNPQPRKGYGVIHSPDRLLTSTTAEMFAAINGVWLAKKYGAQEVLIRSDCMAVIGAVTGGNLSDKMKRIWLEALSHADCSDMALRAYHVRGHTEAKDSASWVNDWCDRHARIGMIKARKGLKCLELL